MVLRLRNLVWGYHKKYKTYGAYQPHVICKPYLNPESNKPIINRPIIIQRNLNADWILMNYSFLQGISNIMLMLMKKSFIC